MKYHFVITAGGTREYIDPVRFISNASSGRMGYALAEVALKAGHRVTLISAMTNLVPPRGAKIIPAETSGEMFREVKKALKKCDVLIMAAAVSDYKVEKASKVKIKKSDQPIVLKLVPTTDILKWAGEHKTSQYIVGFALEDRAILSRARKKLRDKRADMIVANSPSAIGALKSRVYVLTAGGVEKIGPASKEKIAKKIVEKILAQIA
jgi:phosphopantothenoylcysteine decarboxylase/phosphopantothenate--cysteine ligase